MLSWFKQTAPIKTKFKALSILLSVLAAADVLTTYFAAEATPL